MLIKQIISAAQNCGSEEKAQELLDLLTEDLTQEINCPALNESPNNQYWLEEGKYRAEVELQHIFSHYFGLSLSILVGREIMFNGEPKISLEARIETVQFKDEKGDGSQDWAVFLDLEDHEYFYEDSTFGELSSWIEEKLIAQYESMLTACGVSSTEAQKLAKSYWVF